MIHRLAAAVLPPLLLLAGLGCLGGSAPSPTPTPAPTGGATGELRLVVLLVIDQLPSWSFDQAVPQLDGGLGRMVSRGTHFARAELPYSNTFTASGHAALATGAPPAVTGIVANEWHRDDLDDPVGSCDDDRCDLLGPRATAGAGRSSRWLRVEGVADVLERRSGGRARTVALSLKDRSAVLTLGRRPDLAVWWDPVQAMMTTSSFYVRRLPSWLDPERHRPLLAATWTPIADPALLRRLAGGEDDGASEAGPHGLDTTYPHELAPLAHPGKAILDTPFATRILFETAIDAVRGERLGADDVVNLLAVSVSSHDYAGHGWGQESWERWDLLLDLDDRLGGFFRVLDAEVGAGRWAAVLSSDHGALHLPARARALGIDVHVIDKRRVTATAEAAARQTLGAAGPWVRGFSGNAVRLTPAFTALPPSRRTAAFSAMIAAISRLPGTGLVERTSALTRGGCAARAEPTRRRACASLPPGDREAIYALPAVGSQYVNELHGGSTHGGDSAEERTVPILILGPGWPARREDRPVSLLQVAPTLAALLRVPPPPTATEPALRPPAR